MNRITQVLRGEQLQVYVCNNCKNGPQNKKKWHIFEKKWIARRKMKKTIESWKLRTTKYERFQRTNKYFSKLRQKDIASTQSNATPCQATCDKSAKLFYQKQLRVHTCSTLSYATTLNTTIRVCNPRWSDVCVVACGSFVCLYSVL